MKPFYTIMFVLSVLLLCVSIAALIIFGLNFGVDFTGGSLMELEFRAGRPSIEEVAAFLKSSGDSSFGDVSITPVGASDLILRMGELTEDEHRQILGSFDQKFGDLDPKEKRFDSIGPSIGRELKRASIIAIVILLAAVLVYIAYMFRALAKSLSLVAMAIGTLLGLAHDILIPMGLFAVLGHFYGVQITAVYVAAVLTILGYTVSDKVVIYDRVRENILRGSREPLPDLVHKSVMQTLIRSINNTLVVILSSLAVFLFGGESIRYFALALMVGIGLGAYSSIFVASPTLVWLSRKVNR